MVGYQASDTMSAQQKLFAGCMSGVLTRFITQPLDVIKLRVQLQKKGRRTIRLIRTTKKILSEEGLQAFFQGHNLGQVHSVLAVSSQFYVFEMCTQWVANSTIDKEHHAMLNYVCGLFAGCVSATLSIPLEVIRVRQIMVSQQYKGIFNGAREVYKSGGILAFYGGLSASLLQMGPAVSLSFGTFSAVQPFILSLMHDCNEGNCHHAAGNAHNAQSLLIASTIAGSFAGFVSKTLTYPFDLAKRRLQLATHQKKKGVKIPSTSKHLIRCKKLTECVIETIKHEGVTGLFRGLTITLYKSQVTSIVAFSSYEIICFFIRELNEVKIV